MSRIIRVSKRENYTVLDNHFVNDEGLTWQATGVLAYLLSKSDNWTVAVSDLWERKKNGRDAVRSILRELETAGYLRRTVARNNAGAFVSESVVYEQPSSGLNTNVDSSESNHDGFPAMAEKPPQVITDCIRGGGRKNKPSSKPHPAAEEIYAAYPRKVARPVALAAITKAIGRGHPPDKLLAKVASFAGSVSGTDPKFIPHPATWFNQDRFDDGDSPSLTGLFPPRPAEPDLKHARRGLQLGKW